jgi:cellobiose phosphorylase
LRSDYSDDLLWLPFAVLYYLYETADLSCLDKEIPFFDGGSASLLEHCLRAFKVALARRSERGLSLILAADWNDGLNAIGPGARGESIWMSHFLHYLLRGWSDLPVLDEETRARFRAEAKALRTTINTHGWDSEWYWRATSDDGTMLGSDRSKEGHIFLNAQTWAVLSEVATEERARQAMASAREHLYTPYGPLLFAPGYTQPNADIGYLSRYAPGVRENGGVYVHAACWAVLAERRINGAEAAYALWRSFCPVVRGHEPDVYAVEPYVMPGNVNGPQSASPGRGGWTWYTGSAAWYLRVLIEGVLGIESRLSGLRVQAELPAGWDGFRLKRRFRGATYDIRVRRAAEGEHSGCTINGKPWQAEFLPIAEPGMEQIVEILLRD